MTKPLAMPVLVDRWLLGTEDFSLEEQGAYFRLLCKQWRDGALPDLEDKILDLFGALPRRRARAIWATIGVKFERVDGRLLNVTLEGERAAAQAFAETRSASAAKAARARWEALRQRSVEDASRIPSSNARASLTHDGLGLGSDASASSRSRSPVTSKPEAGADALRQGKTVRAGDVVSRIAPAA